MYKVVVVNFKNLIDEEEAISTKTMLLIDNLRRKKYKFVITTEKDYKDVLLYNASFPFIDYIMSYNGNITYDVNKSKYLINKSIAPKVVSQIAKLFYKYELVYYKENNKVYQIKVKDITQKSFKEIISSLNFNNNYYQVSNDFYLTSSKIDEKKAIERLTKNKKNLSLTVIPYSEIDYSLLQTNSNNYILKTSDDKLKRLLKDKNNYMIEESIEKILTKLDMDI